MRRLLLIVLLAIVPRSSFAAAPTGISRELARERALLITDLHYRVYFRLRAQGLTAPGHEEIRFRLSAAQPVLLDYRDGTVRELAINGGATRITHENGHLVLPKEKLRVGENTIYVDFVSGVAPAGKAITRFLDKDDG
ncbi:MAG TPA: hypothetical protein VM912_13185, partial [Terriglobales bacterium]|nr:hypothetical protein [Terriglobales bacterium]